MKARRSWFVVALVASLACGALPACEGFFASGKIASGQRYQSEDQRYDPYFDNVHQAQVAAAAWPDDKKAARKPLMSVLSLTPTAGDDTIVSATRDRVRKSGAGGTLDLASAHVTGAGAGDAPLFAAVEETVRLELDRARKLKEKVDKLEELSKQGEGLKESADKEFSNRGADKADEKKTEKSREVRRELVGAVDATHTLSRDAARGAHEAQDFLEDLVAALEAKDAPRRSRLSRGERPPLPPAPPKPDEKKPEEKKPDDKPAKPSKPQAPASKPKPAPADTPAPADKPATKPAPPPDEVFNP